MASIAQVRSQADASSYAQQQTADSLPAEAMAGKPIVMVPSGTACGDAALFAASHDAERILRAVGAA